MSADRPVRPRRRPGATAAAALVTLLLPVLSPPPSAARTEAPDPAPPRFRIDEFSGWFHNAGNLLLHVSNRALFGTLDGDETFPSAEWPAGSGHDYLYGAGLWVGAVLHRGGEAETLVSSSPFQIGEWSNREPDEGCGNPIQGICESFEGAPAGLRLFDDDGDGSVDEDPLDGADNDADGRIDEDFAGISQQMFRAVYYDTSTFANPQWTNDADLHTPLGLKVTQESYVWTDPLFDDFVGIEFRVQNISRDFDPTGAGWVLDDAYIGFMVDSDVGIKDRDVDRHLDDNAGFAAIDTLVPSPTGGPPVPLQLTLGYMSDEPGLGGDDVPGYLGVMFLGHTVDTTAASPEEALAPPAVGIHAFRVFSGQAGQDPRDDIERYRFLRGAYDTAQSIGPPSPKPDDWRILVSAGPFARIPPESTLTFQVAFVCGDMVERPNGSGALERVPDFTNPVAAQTVYNGYDDPDTGERIHWATSSPPPPPNLRVVPGDNHVVVEWDDYPERTADPLTRQLDFAGYQVWKAEGWRRESTLPSESMWRLIADFDSTELSDVDTGLTGVGKYRFVDNRAKNGFWYWYAVSAFDRGTFFTSIDSTASPPETLQVRIGAPKFGKYSQNMVRVMPRSTAAQTLDDVYVVPNPYREAAAWDLAETAFEPTGRRIKFFNLPERATIRIFTLAGDHVITLQHDDRTTAERPGQTAWNLVSKNSQDTVSGIYLYHVTAPDGGERVGKFVVIR